MQVVAALSSRAVFGLVIGLFLAVVGWLAGWFATPPGPQINISLLIFFSGLGASAGGFVGWFKPEVPFRVTALHLGLSLAGGIAGGWVGWIVGQAVYPEGFRNPVSSFGSPPFVAAFVGGTVGANVLASGFYIFRLLRYREL